ncbi:MAG: DUF3592 domain-containing protein [Rhodobacteraceae bacterium]|nr:DUF3592 domain-containing protein [Paracoccaceae bacterium]
MAKTKNAAGFIKIAFGLMGLIFLVAGAILTFLAYDFMDNALPVSGRVTSVEVIAGDDSVSYKPTIRYVDSAGRKQSGQTFISSSNYNFAVGSSVNVLYDIRDPSSLRMDTWIATWGLGLIFLGGSVLPFFIARVIGRVTGRKLNAKTNPKRKFRRANTLAHVAGDTVKIPARSKGLKSREHRGDHERETTYTPAVRRNR